MGCKILIDESGHGIGIACSRGNRNNCDTCGKPSIALCDFPLEGPKAGLTCDARMCDACRHPIGPNRDYCPVHWRLQNMESA